MIVEVLYFFFIFYIKIYKNKGFSYEIMFPIFFR